MCTARGINARPRWKDTHVRSSKVSLRPRRRRPTCRVTRPRKNNELMPLYPTRKASTDALRSSCTQTDRHSVMAEIIRRRATACTGPTLHTTTSTAPSVSGKASRPTIALSSWPSSRPSSSIRTSRVRSRFAPTVCTRCSACKRGCQNGKNEAGRRFSIKMSRIATYSSRLRLR